MPLINKFSTQGRFLFRHRGELPIILLLVAFVIYLYNQVNALYSNVIIEDFIFERFCLGITLSGLLLRLLINSKTHKNTSGGETKNLKADAINRTGFYSIIRHPLYASNLIMWSGIALLTKEFWFIISFICMYTLYYERIMIYEEDFLMRKFDSFYLDWANSTPAFIPNFLLWKNPEGMLQLKKSLTSEKNGLLATFVIFFIFQTSSESLINEKLTVRDRFVAYGLIASVIIYLVLRILKKRKISH